MVHSVIRLRSPRRMMVLPLRAAVVLPAAFLFAAGVPALTQAPSDGLPEAPAKAVILRACSSCHQPTVVVSKPHTAEEWDEIVDKMIGLGAELTDAEQEQIISYLALNFGPNVSRTPPPPP